MYNQLKVHKHISDISFRQIIFFFLVLPLATDCKLSYRTLWCARLLDFNPRINRIDSIGWVQSHLSSRVKLPPKNATDCVNKTKARKKVNNNFESLEKLIRHMLDGREFTGQVNANKWSINHGRSECYRVDGSPS